MVKFIGILVLAILAFAGAMAGMLAVTGNLNKESLDRVLGRNQESAAPVEAPDDVDPIAKALKDREEQLNKREAAVVEKEAQVKTVQQDLERTRSEIEAMLKQVTGSLDAEDKGKDERLQQVAKVIEKMDVADAAKILETKEPKDAVALLQLISERNRPKILNEIDPAKAAAILDAMQAPAS